MNPSVDVIEVKELGTEVLLCIPGDGYGSLRIGAQIVVQKGQSAVVDLGDQALDVLAPGAYTLTPDCLPMLTGGRASDEGTVAARVCFVSMRLFADGKWGTPAPVQVRSADDDRANFRMWGTCAFQVTDPRRFVEESTSRGIWGRNRLAGLLQSMLVRAIALFLNRQYATGTRPLWEVLSSHAEIEEAVSAAMVERLAAMGLVLKDFQIEGIQQVEAISGQRQPQELGTASTGLSEPNLSTVRDLLNAAFTPADLRQLCLESTELRPVVTKFGHKYNLDDMSGEVIDFCRTRLLWDELLAAVKESRPRQYQRYAADLWS